VQRAREDDKPKAKPKRRVVIEEDEAEDVQPAAKDDKPAVETVKDDKPAGPAGTEG
jgi:hypothetical protein